MSVEGYLGSFTV